MVRALVLGLVQGATEFLPISSSAHLVLVPYALGWSHPGLAFDVVLHLGTLLAVGWHFRRDLTRVVTMTLRGGRSPERRLGGLLVAASVPVAVAGVAFESHVERAFAEPAWTAGFLLATAVLLLAAEGVARRVDALPSTDAEVEPSGADPATRVGWGDAVVIGLAQAAALLPGVSRSGSTIAAGLLRGVDRQAATRFSFLLSIPVMVGAIAVQVPEVSASALPAGDLAVGVFAAFVSGLWAIRFLLRVISTRGLTGFAVYVALLALAVLALPRAV